MKMTVITDSHGKLLGSIRREPIQNGKHLMQVRAVPKAGQTHHDVEVEEDDMRKPAQEVHDMLLKKVSAGKR